MITLAANLSTMFTESPLEQRFEQAAAAGFHQVELQFPYSIAASRLGELLRENGLTLALFNAPAGDLAAGDRGVLLSDETSFTASFALATEYLSETRCRNVHVMIGTVRAGTSLDWSVVATRLAIMARGFEKYEASLMLEPLNSIDQPRYALASMADAEQLRASINRPNICLQLDAYHAVRSGRDPVALFERHLAHIGHIQVADGCDRGEPTGSVMQGFLNALDRRDWPRSVGCEYVPRSTTADGLIWAARFGIRSPSSSRSAHV